MKGKWKFEYGRRSVFLSLLLSCSLAGGLFPLAAGEGENVSPGKKEPSVPAAPPVSPASAEKKGGKGEEKGKVPPGTERKTAPADVPREQEEFFRKLSLILSAVRKASPHTGKVLDEKFRNDPFSLIRNFLQSPETGIVCVTVSPASGKSVPKRADPLPGGRSFVSERVYAGRILYIFLPDLSPKNCEKCLEALEELPGTLAGIVLDLRRCRSYGSAPMMDPLLGRLREIAEKRDGNTASPRLALLLGNGTKGTGEILAFRLNSFSSVLSVGTATAGQPFLLRPLPLKFSHTPSAGKGVPGERKVMRFLVPVIPEKWKNVPPSAVRPRIRTKVLPMYGEGGETSPDKDPSLRIASDLLLSLDAMKKRFP